MIRLDIKQQQIIINSLFGNLDNSFFQIIKAIEKEYPLPKFKEAYHTFVGTAEEYTEKIRAYDNACLLREILIKRLADEFVQMHVRESNDPANKYWILKENELDFSLESLNKLDKKNTYTDHFKQSFCNSHILPLLTGYVLHTILMNIAQHGWEVRYNDNIYNILFKPSAGSKEIIPCDYIKNCFFSGFKYYELYNCLQSNVSGLSEIYQPWRRQYLSENSNPWKQGNSLKTVATNNRLHQLLGLPFRYWLSGKYLDVFNYFFQINLVDFIASDFALDATVKNYPNPATNSSNILLNLQKESAVAVTIYNSNGAVVSTKDYGQLNGNLNIPVDLARYANGMYFVNVTIDGNTSISKLIKQ